MPRPRFARPLLSALTCLCALTLNVAPASASLGGSSTTLVPEANPNLQVIDWVLWDLSRGYVDPSRFDPQVMTMAAIEALEVELPEVKVEIDGDVAMVEVAGKKRRFKIEATAIWSIAPALESVMGFVLRSTRLEGKARHEAEYAMIDGLLASLDPHTNLLRPSAFEDLATSTQGQFGGLGIEIGMRDGIVTVLRVLDGNPADEAGLEEGDRIVQINDESAVAMPTEEVVQRLRGQKGSFVDIYVRREGNSKPIKYTIRRDTIKLESLTGDVIPGKKDGKDFPVGVIIIRRNFSQTTGPELREQLAEFEEAGVQGIVLDMRHNPGGLMGAAVEVSDAFLSAGAIVSMVGAHTAREESRADTRYDFRNVPLAVLVNQSSASATEIVTGALRNHDRAIVVGRRTFGKGSVQVLHPRRIDGDDYALKLTIAQYMTPGDISIQGVGVSPDLETLPVHIGDKYTSFYGRQRFDRLREESLDASLTHSTARPQAITAGSLYHLDGHSPDRKEDESKPLVRVRGPAARARALLRDPELSIARDLVMWAPSADRSVILESIDEFLNAESQEHEKAITRSFAKAKIDWKSGPAPKAGQVAKLSTELIFSTPDARIKAGETATLTLRVTNTGDAPAFRVRAMSDSDYTYFNERELFFGRIDPGKTREATLELSVDKHELSRSDRIAFLVADQHGSELAEAHPSLEVHGAGIPRPRLAYSFQILDLPKKGRSRTIKQSVTHAGPNGDGALQVGERVLMRVRVENLGDGIATDPLVQLSNESGEAVFLNEARGKIGRLAPGEHKEIDLDFEVRAIPLERAASFELLIADLQMGEAMSDRIRIPVRSAQSADVGVSPESKGVEVLRDVDLVDAAVGTRHTVARAKAGTKLKASARFGEWIRVGLGKGRFAFVHQDEVKAAKAPRATPKVELTGRIETPRVTLESPPTIVDAKTVRLKGTATHPERVRDLFVQVYNPSRDLFGNPDKVHYLRPDPKDPTRVEFEIEVPLRPGNNLISISARHDEQVVEHERVWVLRTLGLDEKRAQEAATKRR